MKIGIFDSGRGGEFIHERIATSCPGHEYLVVNDRENLPYGDKTPEVITHLTDLAIQPLLSAQCDVIVLACNTATAAAIDALRVRYPSTAFIGFEPMLKPLASLTKSGTVTVLATAATRTSTRYQALKRRYAAHLTIIEPDTTDWARLIELGRAEEIDLNHVAASIAAGSDAVALACTHYLELETSLNAIVGRRAHLIEPTPAVIRQLSRLNERRPTAH